MATAAWAPNEFGYIRVQVAPGDYERALSSCLEEILLHTCEPFGEGVASPHTSATLHYIRQLKQKHGIDYDCHASYRFVEKS